MYGRLSLVAALMVVAASSANAQLCAGAAPYTTGRMQVGGSMMTSDDYSSYGIGLNLGTARSFWGGAHIGNNDYDFVDESGMVIGASGGYQMRPARAGFQICPVAALSFGMGPDDIAGSGTDMSARQLSAGAIIGMVAHRGTNFQIIPSGGLSIVNYKISLEGPGGSGDESDTFFQLDLGAGFVLNSVWTLRPMLSLPFGDDGRDEMLTLGASYNFGRPATATGTRPAGRTR